MLSQLDRVAVAVGDVRHPGRERGRGGTGLSHAGRPGSAAVRAWPAAEHLGHPAELGPDGLHRLVRYRESDSQVGCHRLPHRDLLRKPVILSDECVNKSPVRRNRAAADMPQQLDHPGEFGRQGSATHSCRPVYEVFVDAVQAHRHMPYRFRVAVFARTTECSFLYGWAYDSVKVPGALHRIADGPGNKVRDILDAYHLIGRRGVTHHEIAVLTLHGGTLTEQPGGEVEELPARGPRHEKLLALGLRSRDARYRVDAPGPHDSQPRQDRLGNSREPHPACVETADRGAQPGQSRIVKPDRKNMNSRVLVCASNNGAAFISRPHFLSVES